jgi:hypothetical protein
MWFSGHYISLSRELLYGIGFLLFLLVIAIVIIVVKRKKKSRDVFPANRIFRGKNLERAGRNRDLDVNYDDMPIVDLKWQKGNSVTSLDYEEENDDDEEDKVDDGYTVVEKAIQEKIQKFQATPPAQKVSVKKDKSKNVQPIKKDAAKDKMDFFTTGKSAL